MKARLLSTATFVLTSIFMVLIASLSTGGILDACNQYTLSGMSHADCRSFWSTLLAGKKVTEGTYNMVAFALIFPRIEASLFLGHGLGGVYALLRLDKGSDSVAVIHFMQAVFFSCACGIHAHNSGLLPFEVDPNIRVAGKPFVPFCVVTGLLAALSWASFLLSQGATSKPTDGAFDHAKQAEEVRAKERAASLLQAQIRGKEVREQEALRKRRSSIGSAEI